MKMVDPYDYGVRGRTHTLTGVRYSDLVRVLGEPNVEDDHYKVDASWGMVSDDTALAAGVWNFKNGPNYLGPEADIEAIEVWSVGATSDEAAHWLALHLNMRGLAAFIS